MGCTLTQDEQIIMEHSRFWFVWHEWARQKPSLFKHPIKYIKWYFSEPDFDKWIKEKNK